MLITQLSISNGLLDYIGVAYLPRFHDLQLLFHAWDTEMVKRQRDIEIQEDRHSVKQFRGSAHSQLSTLSDELVLKIFSYVSVQTLASCQR